METTLDDPTVVGRQEDDPEAIKASIDQIKASMAEKIDTLKHEVNYVVGSAVASAKETVTDVKNELDIRTHIRSNPWAALSTAAVIGFAVGGWIRKHATPSESMYLHDIPYESSSAPHTFDQPSMGSGANEKLYNVWQSLEQAVRSEMEQIRKTITIQALDTVQDMAKEAAPMFAPNIERIREKVSRELV